VWLFLAAFLMPSCRSTDPFVEEAQNSTLNLAERFLEDYENPGTKRTIQENYKRFSEKTREALSLSDFYSHVMSRYARGEIVPRKVEITPWEKFEISDGTVLVYLLKKYKFKPFRRHYGAYDIIRLHLVKENGQWAVHLDEELPFDGFTPVESGDYSLLNEEKVASLHDAVRDNARRFQFDLDMASRPSREESMADLCVRQGERLYDREEYRKALMQFQKALSIDPANEKAQTYVDRCKRAINLGLGR
jgi:tetratricopeptide (TPR) repeat protein